MFLHALQQSELRPGPLLVMPGEEGEMKFHLSKLQSFFSVFSPQIIHTCIMTTSNSSKTLSSFPKNFWTAIFAFSTSAMITVVLSLATRQKKSNEELKGLVYSLTPRHIETDVPWYKRSSTLAILVLTIGTILTILFW